MERQPLVVQGLIIVDVPRTHSDTPLSVGLLLASDQPDAITSIWQHVTLKRDRRSCPWGGFEPAIPASQQPP